MTELDAFSAKNFNYEYGNFKPDHFKWLDGQIDGCMDGWMAG